MNNVINGYRALVCSPSTTGQDNALACQTAVCQVWAEAHAYIITSEYAEVVSDFARIHANTGMSGG